MGRHSIADTEQLPVVKQQFRPRVRADRYNTAVGTMSTLLSANIVLIVLGIVLGITAIVMIGPQNIMSMIVVMFALWCFRRRK